MLCVATMRRDLKLDGDESEYVFINNINGKCKEGLDSNLHPFVSSLPHTSLYAQQIQYIVKAVYISFSDVIYLHCLLVD